MRKTLALALALVLALGLAVPAQARQRLCDPDEPYEVSPEEIQAFLDLMEETGAFYVDGQPVDTYPVDETPPMDEEYTYVDPYEQYAQDHPEELAALDVDALIAGWGYEDLTAREQFMLDHAGEDESLEDAVRQEYIELRVLVGDICADAAAYKADYPEQWESFDADAYFEREFARRYDGKTAYMAVWCIFTQEEFADDMFVDYMDDYLEYGDVIDWDDDWLDPDDEEPSLTLVVNGVVSDVAIAANNWTTYADANDLRAILGADAVAPGYDGPVPVREAAENAGWDVVWYDRWGDPDQQVCLWNKELVLEELEPQVAPFQQVVDAVIGLARQTLSSETPLRQTQTATLTCKLFDTLDGDKTYTMKFRAEAVIQKGVADMTMTMDLSPLVDILPADTVKYAALGMDLTADQLKERLGSVKMEAIVDYNEGATAVRMPLLDQLDPGLGEWQTSYSATPDWLGGLSYAESLYDDMVRRSEWRGGVSAREDVEEQVAMDKLVIGPDSLKKVGSTITWELKTDQINKALLTTDDISYFDEVPPFNKFDLNLRISDDGNYDLAFALRPNAVTPAMIDRGDFPGMFLATGDDFDLALTARGDGRKASASMKLHVKNYGVFDLSVQTTTSSATQGPRQIKDVERLWVEPAQGNILTRAK